MALRLNDFVLRGEIRNDARNSVSGWLEVLRFGKNGDTEPALVVLSFAGNLSGELDGRTFRFEVREKDLPQPRPVLEAGIQSQQIGFMGDNVYRMIRVPIVSVEEFPEECDQVETPPEEERASIYLEWYSQNGRVVLELLDPKIEFEGDYRDLANVGPGPSPETIGPSEITTIVRNADGTFDVIHNSIDSENPEDTTDKEDQFSLFPENLEEQICESAVETVSFEAEPTFGIDELWAESRIDAEHIPATPRNWDEVIPGIDPETKAMYEQWDEVIYGTKDEPLTWLFEEPLCLPRPDDVRDESHAWMMLLSLLAAMALRGVAFDMCRHYTAVRAYRLLIEDLLPQAGVHPNLVATGFVKHYSSWEHCAECDAEFDEHYRARHPDE